MKFAVFAYKANDSGDRDYLRGYATFKKAMAVATTLVTEYYQVHIFDVNTLKIVWSKNDFDKSSDV